MDNDFAKAIVQAGFNRVSSDPSLSQAEIDKARFEMIELLELIENGGQLDPLVALQSLDREYQVMRETIVDCINAARKDRYSWADIGKVLGISGEGARQRAQRWSVD